MRTLIAIGGVRYAERSKATYYLMERVHNVRLSRGLSDEEDENDSLAALDDDIEKTPPSEDANEEGEGEATQGHEEKFEMNE